MKSSRAASVFLTLLALTAAACSAEPSVASDDADLVGAKGTPADEPALDAVGRIFIGGIGGCVGTLVSPQIVISGRHCRVLAGRSGLNPDDVTFEIAKTDADNHRILERKRFRVFAELTTGRAGVGMLGIGRDVAVLMLNEPVPASLATPIPVRARPLDASDIGKRFTGVAFDGIHSWIKKKGPSTLDSVSGKPYEKAFTTLAKAKAAAQREIDEQNASRTREPGTVLKFDESDFNGELSEEAYEVHVGLTAKGRARADVQFCHGDSGGPLLEGNAGHYEVVAVVTGGEDECVLGGVATSIGADYQEALPASVGSTPWAWACEPKDSKRDAAVSRCSRGRKTSCSGYYFAEEQWFTNINVESCGAK